MKYIEFYIYKWYIVCIKQNSDRYLLTLRQYIDGSYTNVTPVSSYFFIADDNKIYPAGNDTPTLKYSGMDLSAAKRDMRSVVKRVATKG